MTSPTLRQRSMLGEPLDLDAELRQAVADIECGDCIELTPEQLDRCVVDGEWPWPDESHA